MAFLSAAHCPYFTSYSDSSLKYQKAEHEGSPSMQGWPWHQRFPAAVVDAVAAGEVAIGSAAAAGPDG